MHRKKPVYISIYRVQFYRRFQANTRGLRTYSQWIRGTTELPVQHMSAQCHKLQTIKAGENLFFSTMSSDHGKIFCSEESLSRTTSM